MSWKKVWISDLTGNTIEDGEGMRIRFTDLGENPRPPRVAECARHEAEQIRSLAREVKQTGRKRKHAPSV